MKRTTHCSACGALGHWAGDPECTASSKGGKDASKGKSNSKDRGSGAKKVLRILHHDAGSTVVRETEEDQGSMFLVNMTFLVNEVYLGRWRVPVFEPFGFGHRVRTYAVGPDGPNVMKKSSRPTTFDPPWSPLYIATPFSLARADPSKQVTIVTSPFASTQRFR